MCTQIRSARDKHNGQHEDMKRKYVRRVNKIFISGNTSFMRSFCFQQLHPPFSNRAFSSKVPVRVAGQDEPMVKSCLVFHEAWSGRPDR